MPWRSPPDRLATVEIDGDADAAETDDVEQDLARDLLLPLDVDESEAVGDLPADKEIAPERLLLRQRLVLIDGLDRQIVRHANRILVRLDFAVADEDFARCRRVDAGQDLDQGRLARAVVPDEADDLVASDGDVDVAQRMHRPKILLDAREANDRGKLGCGRRHSIPPARFRTTSAVSSYRYEVRANRPPWQEGASSRRRPEVRRRFRPE